MGAPRAHGELLMLGIEVSESTLARLWLLIIPYVLQTLEFCADRFNFAGILSILSAIVSLWSSSGFGVGPLWNCRCWPSDIRLPFSVGSGPACF